MAWKPGEIDACLSANRMLEHILELVEVVPPADPALKQNVKDAVTQLLTGNYTTMFGVRCARILRAYLDAARALDLAPGSRNATWQACLSELEHAHAGD